MLPLGIEAFLPKLVKKYYQGSIPHVVLLDKSGRAVYNSAGEVESNKVSALLDKALQP